MKNYYLLFSSIICVATLYINEAHAQERRQITIATEGYLRPYNFTRPDGTLDGYEIELGQYLCKNMNLECRFVAHRFEGIIDALNAGKFDVIMAGLSATKAREEIIDFSTSYSLTPQVFATQKGRQYASLGGTEQTIQLSDHSGDSNPSVDAVAREIKGAKVGVVIGSVGATLVDTYFKNDVSVVRYKNIEEGILDLQAELINLIVSSRAFFTATQKKQQYEDIVMTGPYFKGGILGRGVAVGFRKNDNELAGLFNRAIGTAKADGTLKKLSEKWFGFDVTP